MTYKTSIVRLILTALAVFMASGCASPVTRPTVEKSHFSSPEVGAKATASIGDRMLLQGMSERFRAVDLLYPVSIKGEYSVSAGQYQVIAEQSDYLYLAPYPGGSTVDPQGAISSKSGADANKRFVRLNKQTGQACVVDGIGTIRSTWCSVGGAQFEEGTGQAFSQRSFQQTLLYSGRTGDYITLRYREFSGGYARSAFENEARYDLGESKVISYKGATIEVLEATNQHIKFRLVKGFNDGV